MRNDLYKHKLHQFELVSLANLAPETPDEVKVFLPSVDGRFDDDELAALLEDIQTKRSFQY